MVIFFKILFRKFLPLHRSTLLYSNVVKFVRLEINEIVRYLPHEKQNFGIFQIVTTSRIAPKICQVEPPYIFSQCSKFHLNRFTFGGVIAERVKAVFLAHRVFEIFAFWRIITPLHVHHTCKYSVRASFGNFMEIGSRVQLRPRGMDDIATTNQCASLRNLLAPTQYAELSRNRVDLTNRPFAPL